MRHLVERLGSFLGEPLMEGKEYDLAKAFLDKGILPDGDKWPKGKPKVIVGFDGTVDTKRIRGTGPKGGSKTAKYKFDLELKPGSGGGGGASIDPAASNHYFNMAGTDAPNIKGMKGAFEAAVKGSTKSLGQQIHKWFSVPDNWVWRIVGWGDRKGWTKPDVKILGIKTSGTMIDPTRRKWPSGRTEIWVPLTVTVQAEMKRK